VTTPPEFRDLVGDEGTPEELERLRRVHDLLVAAGPPSELSPELERAPAVKQDGETIPFRRRRPATAFGLAAAAVLAAFLIGFVVGGRDEGFTSVRTLSMAGVGPLAAARANLEIADKDEAGNWPLRMTVRGLKELPKGGWYELSVTRKGKIGWSCGTFVISGDETTVELSVPYDLSLISGWVVTAHVPGRTQRGQKILMRSETI